MAKSTSSKACGFGLVMVSVLLQATESGGILVKYNVTLAVENEMGKGQTLDSPFKLSQLYKKPCVVEEMFTCEAHQRLICEIIIIILYMIIAAQLAYFRVV